MDVPGISNRRAESPFLGSPIVKGKINAFAFLGGDLLFTSGKKLSRNRQQSPTDGMEPVQTTQLYPNSVAQGPDASVVIGTLGHLEFMKPLERTSNSCIKLFSPDNNHNDFTSSPSLIKSSENGRWIAAVSPGWESLSDCVHIINAPQSKVASVVYWESEARFIDLGWLSPDMNDNIIDRGIGVRVKAVDVTNDGLVAVGRTDGVLLLVDANKDRRLSEQRLGKSISDLGFFSPNVLFAAVKQPDETNVKGNHQSSLLQIQTDGMYAEYFGAMEHTAHHIAFPSHKELIAVVGSRGGLHYFSSKEKKELAVNPLSGYLYNPAFLQDYSIGVIRHDRQANTSHIVRVPTPS